MQIKNIVGNFYKYPNSDDVFRVKQVFDHKIIFECGHWCTDSVFPDLINLENNIQNYKIKTMPKLNKPRGFEVSKQTDVVTISGKQYETANLLKSGITLQTKILIAVDDIWHEIDVLNLGADNSNLQDFANFTELHSLKLSDFGITESKPVIDYDLKHQDFEQLESEFPDYSYIKISHLNDYLIKSVGKSSMYSLRETLKMLVRDNKTIDVYIEESEAQKHRIINGEKPNTYKIKMEKQNRIIELVSYGLVENPNAPGTYSGHGFEVSADAIEKDTPEAWAEFMERIKAVAPEPIYSEKTVEKHQAVPVTQAATTAEAPAKKPISLSVISALQPSRISELKGLKEAQEAIVKANPIITPTDKKSRDEAQKRASALLKASTAIDGKTGILATFVTHANQFIKMGKDYLTPLAKITRDQHDKQKALVVAWDSTEEIRVQNEKKAELVKIKNRTDRLFAVPFVFNGSLYSIGTLYIMPSDIEKWTDEEFDAKIKEGETLLAASKSVDHAKNNAIRQAAETLRQYNPEAADQILIDAGLMEAKVTMTGQAGPPVETLVTPGPTVQTGTVPAATSIATVTPEANTATNTQQTAANTTGPVRFVPSMVYELPDPSNPIVNAFDMQHFGLINENPIPPAFIKCRAYFIEGTRQTAIEIQKILDGENVVNGLKKSERIAKLCEILKSAK